MERSGGIRSGGADPPWPDDVRAEIRLAGRLHEMARWEGETISALPERPPEEAAGRLMRTERRMRALLGRAAEAEAGLLALRPE